MNFWKLHLPVFTVGLCDDVLFLLKYSVAQKYNISFKVMNDRSIYEVWLFCQYLDILSKS